MGTDANNQIFPLAFAFVEEESFDSWSWFLACLRNVVGDRPGICIISDRHLGILSAIRDESSSWREPYAHHRFCLRHVCSNFNTEFKDANLKKAVWKIGSVHQVHKFNFLMQRLGTINPQAKAWLDMLPVEKWTIAHDGGYRYGMRTTNISEVFNGVLKGARHYPVAACAQMIYYLIVRYFNVRRMAAHNATLSGQTLSPFAVAMLAKNNVKIGRHRVEVYNERTGTVEVTTRKGRLHVVKIGDSSCSCGKWAIYGIPCSHALAVMKKIAIAIEQHVNWCYHIGTYSNTWGPEFVPPGDNVYWPVYTGPTLIPDRNLLRKKGRPRNRRLHNEMDITEGPSRPKRCSKCRQLGHDRRRCPGLGNQAGSSAQ